MALFKRKYTNDLQENTGLGVNSNYTGGRFYNKDGTVNVQRRGLNWIQRLSVYHLLLVIPTWKFIVVVVVFFISINSLFASLYFLIGKEHFVGMVSTNELDLFLEAFFFSTQTFTTVGYGRINPVGFFANALSSIEALMGLLTFAIVTGLLYGRFSQPRAFIRYSKHALISPYRGGKGLMFRMVSYKDDHLLSEVEVKVTCVLQILENGIPLNKFFSLKLEIDKVNALILGWTLVHPIDEHSPLFGLTMEDIQNAKAEFFVFVKAFDESFSNSVMSRTSYTSDELIYGAKFNMMHAQNKDDTSTVLDIDKIDDLQFVEIL